MFRTTLLVIVASFFMSTTANAEDIKAQNSATLTADLYLTFNDVTGLPTKTIDVKGTYRAGQQAGSGSVLSRHDGSFSGTLSKDGTLKFKLEGKKEIDETKVTSTMSAKLTKVDGKWLLKDVKEDKKK